MRTVTRRGESFQVRNDSELDWDNFWDLWESEAWEPRSLDVIDDRLRSGGVFVDVGAWVGPLTLWASRLADRIVAVEPDAVALQGLHDNLQANSPNGCITTVFEGAVTDEAGKVRIAPVKDGHAGDSMMRVSEVGVEVPALTLPELLRDCGVHPSGVALVKIDVEGYESVLMPTLAPWLAEHGICFQLAIHGRRPDLSAVADTHTVYDSWVYEESFGPCGDVVGIPH